MEEAAAPTGDGRRQLLLDLSPLLVELGHGRDEHSRVGVSRVAEHLVRCAHLHDGATTQDDGLFADVVAQRQVVGDEQNPQAPALEIGQQIEDIDARGRVEHADDLIGNQDLEVQQQRSGNQQPLELAAAELMRVLVEDLIGLESDRPQHTIDLGVPFRARHVSEELAAYQAEDAVRLEDWVIRTEGVLENSLNVPVIGLELGALLVRHVDPVKRDRALRDVDQLEHHLPNGGLAAAAFPDERNDLARVDVETDVANRDQVLPAESACLVGLGDAVEAKH